MPKTIVEQTNLGLEACDCDVVVFTNDNVEPFPDWLARIEPYCQDEMVGGVGGRVIDAQEQARAKPEDPRIGVLQPDGEMTTNFILDPDQPIEVDHVRGCNMSFRRDSLQRIGAFDPRYDGTNVCEENDVCLRTKSAGWRTVYQPAVVVYHLSAPRESYDRGKWLTATDSVLYLDHNRFYLLFKNFGVNRSALGHNLIGMQVLYLQFWRDGPNWET